MSKFKGHGYRVKDERRALRDGTVLRDTDALFIGNLPGRKSVALYRETVDATGALLHPLAYFSTEEDAQAALDMLDALVRAASTAGLRNTGTPTSGEERTA